MRSRTTIRTDRDIRAAVLTELTDEPRVPPAGIDVTVDEGVVALRGRVPGHAGRWAAEQAAHRATRVRAVANDLAVAAPPAPPGHTDRAGPALAAAVAHALEWEAFVPPEAIEVTVAGNRVTLRGRLRWEYQRRAVARAVRRLPGVRGVSDRITVRPGTTPAG